MLKKEVKRILGICLVLFMFLSMIGTSFAIVSLEFIQTKVIELKPDEKLSSDLLEKMQKSKSNEKISVSIWLTDINQEAIEGTVAKRTGLTRNNLEVIQDYMSDELALRVMTLSDENVVDKKLKTVVEDVL
jgi:predicted PurR-regulated permease PerM